MTTLKDVAALAGVTATTASRALRGLDSVTPKTTKRVIDAARKLGYRMNVSARSLKSGRSGIVTFLTSGIEGTYFSSLAMRFSRELARHGMQMLIQTSRFSTGDIDENGLSFALSDGIIAVNARGFDDMLSRFPSVVLEDYAPDRSFDRVNAPSEAGARAAVRHLVERGCRSVALLGGGIPDDPAQAASQEVRLVAARDEMSKLGLPEPGGELFVRTAWSLGGAVEAGRRLAERTSSGNLPFDGIFCPSDALAIGLMRGLADHGIRVPDSALVIGFDGLAEGAYGIPSLSTVLPDYDGMVESAVSLLRKRIEHPDAPAFPQTVSVGYRLLARESTTRR